MFIKTFVVVFFFSIAIAGSIPDAGIVESDADCPDCVECYLKCKCILPGTDIIKNFSDYIQPRPAHCPKCNCAIIDDCLEATTYMQCPSQ